MNCGIQQQTYLLPTLEPSCFQEPTVICTPGKLQVPPPTYPLVSTGNLRKTASIHGQDGGSCGLQSPPQAKPLELTQSLYLAF